MSAWTNEAPKEPGWYFHRVSARSWSIVKLEFREHWMNGKLMHTAHDLSDASDPESMPAKFWGCEWWPTKIEPPQ